MTATRPWLLELVTDDGVGFHSSRHMTSDEADARRAEVLAAWRARGWGQDPAADHISAKANQTCASDLRGSTRRDRRSGTP